MTIAPVQTNFDMMVADEGGRHATPVPVSDADRAAAHAKDWGGDGFGFDDALDVVNPLQHLPVVGTVYREMSGDTIAPAARVLGGLIFGGPIGFVLAIASSIFEEATGKSVGTALADLVTGEDEPVQVASADADGTAGTAAGAETPPTTATPPSQAETQAEMQAQAQALAELAPAAGTSSVAPAGAPQLSPQAFEALMRSFNSAPTAAAAAAATTAAATTVAPADAPLPELRPAPKAAPTPVAPNMGAIGQPTSLLKAPKAATPQPAVDDRRQAALDLHEQLRAYAAQKGVSVVSSPTR